MPYPEIPNFNVLLSKLKALVERQHEYGVSDLDALLQKAYSCVEETVSEIESLPIDKELALKEPNELSEIKSLRPEACRKLWNEFDEKVYRDKLAGAFLGRMAGCTLGAPVEFYSIEKMANLANENSQEFPPVEYWNEVPFPSEKRYEMSKRLEYTRDAMNGVPVDDDIVYTLLGLLIVEDFGLDFSVENVGEAWLKYLPYACTAEDVALKNLKKGIPASKVADIDNPYCEWIGGDIRSDPWGYLAPGQPEKAAEMAYKDAYISHRRQGIYGTMYFAAAISAAFAVKDPVEALRLGLNEIPAECALAVAVRWALAKAPDIKDYREAREAVNEKLKGMSNVHTINNACLTIWGITIGGTDFTKVIGETVAMGMDNDCTAATAGSIVGAVIGEKGIPEHWCRNFNDTVHSYLIERQSFSINDLINRFTSQASRGFSS